MLHQCRLIVWYQVYRISSFNNSSEPKIQCFKQFFPFTCILVPWSSNCSISISDEVFEKSFNSSLKLSCSMSRVQSQICSSFSSSVITLKPPPDNLHNFLNHISITAYHRTEKFIRCLMSLVERFQEALLMHRPKEWGFCDCVSKLYPMYSPCWTLT